MNIQFNTCMYNIINAVHATYSSIKKKKMPRKQSHGYEIFKLYIVLFTNSLNYHQLINSTNI